MMSKNYLLWKIINTSVHQPVEVRLEEAVLDDAVFLEFGFGEFFGVVCGDVAGGIQDGVSAGVQEDVHTVCPILHRHRDVTVGHTLRQVQEGVAKNYLKESELDDMGHLVNALLDLAEGAFSHVVRPMCSFSALARSTINSAAV